jgi:hypothetical protein
LKIIIVIVAIFAGLYFYPQVNEGSASTCGAVEKRFVRAAFQGNEGADVLMALLFSGASNGALAQAMVKSASPNMPAALSCLRLYYELMFNPDLARDAFRDNPR